MPTTDPKTQPQPVSGSTQCAAEDQAQVKSTYSYSLEKCISTTITPVSFIDFSPVDITLPKTPPLPPLSPAQTSITSLSTPPPSPSDAVEETSEELVSDSSNVTGQFFFNECHHTHHVDSDDGNSDDVFDRELENWSLFYDEEELLRGEIERWGASSGLDAIMKDVVRQLPASVDDMAIDGIEPTTRVDYLIHPWKEEDLWTSWQYLISHRQYEAESERLENAAWRAWAQCKLNLGAAGGHPINWFHVQDTAWLYGPMKSYISREQPSNRPVSNLPPSEGGTRQPKQRKPILKNAPASDAFLRVGASNLTSECRGTTETVVHHSPRPESTNAKPWNRGGSFLVDSNESIRADKTSKPHVRFNTVVQQCIVIEDEEPDDFDILAGRNFSCSPASSDDDGLFMIDLPQRAPKTEGKLRPSETTRHPRMIAPLPSTWISFENKLAKPSIQRSTPEGYDFWDLSMPPSTPPINIPRPPHPSPTASIHYDHFLLSSDDYDDDDYDYDYLNDSLTEQNYSGPTETGKELETIHDLVSAGVLELSPPSQETHGDYVPHTILDMLGTMDIVDAIWYHS